MRRKDRLRRPPVPDDEHALRAALGDKDGFLVS